MEAFLKEIKIKILTDQNLFRNNDLKADQTIIILKQMKLTLIICVNTAYEIRYVKCFFIFRTVPL